MTERDPRVEDALKRFLPPHLGGRDWKDVLHRAGLSAQPPGVTRRGAGVRRGGLGLGLLVAAGLIVIASAAAATVLILFPGRPAPSAVSTVIGQYNHLAGFALPAPPSLLKPGGLPVSLKPTVLPPPWDLELPPHFPILLGPRGFRIRVPTQQARTELRAAIRQYDAIWGSNGLELSNTRGVTAQKLAHGDLVIWGVPTSDGAACTFIQFVDSANTTEPEAGPCASPQTSQPPILYDEGLLAWNLRVVDGHVDPEVAAITVTGPANQKTVVPLYDQFFLFDVPGDGKPRTLTALDHKGQVLARIRIPGMTDPQSFNVTDTSTWSIDPLLDANLLMGLNTRSGVPLILAAKLYPDGKHAAVSVESSATTLADSMAATIALDTPTPFLVIYNDGIIAGHTATDVASVEVEFRNGTNIVLHPFDGFILALIPAAQALKASPPPTVILRNNAGAVSGHYRLVSPLSSPSECVAITAPWLGDLPIC